MTGNSDYGYGDYGGGGGRQPASYDYADYGAGGGRRGGLRNPIRSYDYNSDYGANFVNIQDNFQRNFGAVYNNGAGGIGVHANRGLG